MTLIVCVQRTIKMNADKREFIAGALEGFAASVGAGAKMSGEDFWQTYHGLQSQLYRDMAAEAGLKLPAPMRIWAELMDEKYAEADALDKELGDYINKSELSFIESLARPKRFASVKQNEDSLKEAHRLMDKLIKDAREKKAQAEQAAKEEAEYQKRKTESRQARASAPPPEVKALPEMGKVLKKKDDDDDLYSGTGSGKKGKRK